MYMSIIIDLCEFIVYYVVWCSGVSEVLHLVSGVVFGVVWCIHYVVCDAFICLV